MNFTLIGMSGVGKSTVGKALAKKIGYSFIDVDEVIADKYKLDPRQIMDKFGENKFLEIEEETILSLGDINNNIISPGGSVIYSTKSMNFLKNKSKIIFLNDSVENIRKRFDKSRAIIGLKQKGFQALFEERLILYKKYADITIDLSGDSNVDLIVGNIIKKIL